MRVGGEFEAWLCNLEKGSRVVMSLAMDSATASLEMCKILRGYFACLSKKLGVEVVLPVSRCCLHRTSRAIVRLFEKHKLDGSLFCISTSLTMRETHKQVLDVYKDRCKRIFVSTKARLRLVPADCSA